MKLNTKVSLVLLIIFIILVLAGYYVEGKDIKVYKTIEGKEIYWNKGTYKLQSNMTKWGLSKDESEMIIDQCKLKELQYKHINARHCVLTATSIAWAESSGCRVQRSNNCWGLYKGKYYPTKTLAFKRWLKSYVRYWYSAKDGYFFYGDYGKLSKSKYCTSEYSSKSKVGCPNGKKNFNLVFDNLKGKH